MGIATMIAAWFAEGVEQGCSHMIVACDEFDWEDYPIFVKEPSQFYAEYDRVNGKNMQRIIEVYDLRMPWSAQVKGKVFNMPERTST